MALTLFHNNTFITTQSQWSGHSGTKPIKMNFSLNIASVKHCLVITAMVSVSIMSYAEQYIINVSEPGQLEQILLECPQNSLEDLKLTGTLDINDLKILHTAQGLLRSVKKLDISEIEIVENEDEPYATFSTEIYGNSTIEHFFFSSLERRDIFFNFPSWAIPSYDNYNHFTTSLAQLFGQEATYEEIILPPYARPSDLAFTDNKSIKKIVYSMPPTIVGAKAFADTDVEVVTPLSDVHTVGEAAFAKTHITNWQDAAPKAVGYNAFRECDVESLDMSKIEQLGAYAFYRAIRTTPIDISSLDSIPAFSFYCVRTPEFKFSPSLRYIGNEAFYYTAVSEFNFPESLDYIGSRAVRETPYYDRTDDGRSEDLNKKEKFYDNGIYYLGNCAYELDATRAPKQLVIREGTRGISSNLTKNSNDIETLTFPSSLKVIGSGAFSGLVKLTEINIPSNVERIEEAAFAGCTNIFSLRLGGNLKYVGGGAFGGLKNLYTLYYDVHDFGDWGSKYDDKTVISSDNLTKLTIGPNVRRLPGIDAPNLKTITTEHRTNDTPFELCGHYKFNSIQTAVLPHTLTGYPWGAFTSCSTLKSIKFTAPNIQPNFIIDESAFSGCVELEEFESPQHLTEIGMSAFDGCKLLKSFVFPDGLLKIRELAFHRSGLLAANLPSSIEEMGGSIFSECLDGQEMIVVPQSLILTQGTDLYDRPVSPFNGCLCKGIQIPAAVQERNVCLSMESATTLILEPGATEINAKISGAFDELNLPESIQAINNELYAGNTSEIVIPSNCLRIKSLLSGVQCVYKWNLPKDYQFSGNLAYMTK